MRKNLVVLAALLLCVCVTAPAAAQTSEPQFRLLLHKQHVGTGRSLGVAGWAVVPNALVDGPVKGLFLGGILLKGEGRWTEIMVGESITGGDFSDLLDIRTFAKTSDGRLDGYAEVFCDLDGRKIITLLNTTVAVADVRIGIEADAIFAGDKLKSITGGPRLVLPFQVVEGKTSSFILAYHLEIADESPHFLRAYLLLNF